MTGIDLIAATSDNTVVSEYTPLKRRSDAYQSEADLEKEFIQMLCEQGYEYLPVIAATSDNTVVSEYTPLKRRSDAYQSEADLEKEFIQMLCEQGYEYLPVPKEAELESNLRFQLEKLNDITFSDNEWKRFFKENLANPNEHIVEKTRKIQEDYVQVLKRDDGSSKNIKLIDKDHIHHNILQVINQYEVSKVEGARHNNRYDVTVLVNGLPMVHIELKRRGVAIREAFNQIDRYQRDSFWAGNGLFEYIQIFVISNGTETKYYSNTTRFNAEKEHERAGGSRKKTSNSFEFTSYWSDANNRIIPDLVDFTRTFFARHTLLNVLTKYCIFTAEDMLMVMRPYQITATERILNRIAIAENYKYYGSVKGGGYIWHTTGSGKTLTSFKTARLASSLPYIDKVLFVVDRKDLDYQTMKEYDRFEKGAANSNTSTKVLTKQLSDPNAKIIITTIQKLSTFIKKNPKHPVFDQKVVMIFDECHRSQFGDMHRAVVKNFKKYEMFGFTGTPIFADNATKAGKNGFFTTAQTFGDQLHTYTIVDAIRDKNVLPFRVDYIKTIDSEKQEEDDELIYSIDREKIMMAPERISMVTKYILDHFDQKTYRNSRAYSFNKLSNVAEVASGKQGTVEEIKSKQRLSGFNSILAVSSVEAAKAYYQEFKKQMEADSSKKLRIATIYSYGANEAEPDGILEDENSEDTTRLDQTSRDFLESAIEDYNKSFGTNYSTDSDKFQNYYKDVSLRMKDKEIDLLIVVGMFLTGFDATTLNTLWVDKNLKMHGLIQAFSRTNRILNKEIDLLIVVGMFLTGFDATTLNTLWVDKNLKMHGLIQAFSRTNRILNSVKTFGNIVCFRPLKKQVDQAISLFGDKDAGGIVLLHKFSDYYNGFESKGKHQPGYVEMIHDLLEKFPLDQEHIDSEQSQREFIKLFGTILRMQNLLKSFDDFKGKEIISELDLQDYQSRYLDLKNEWKDRQIEKTDVSNDVVFEIELIKQVEINIDYILMLVEKYRKSHKKDKEVLVQIEKAVGASPELRSKKELIKDFIDQLNGKEDDSEDIESEWNEFVDERRTEKAVGASPELRSKKELIKDFIDQLNGKEDDSEDIESEWNEFVDERRTTELTQIIAEEKLRPEPTWQFMEEAFQAGELRTTGTGVNEILPPASRFNKSGREEKKRKTILRLSQFFDRFFDISSSGSLRTGG